VQEYDTIIIGAGIAGMTAAIYLKRENMNVLIIEKEMPGGQMVKTPIIENYPGFLKIEGSELALNIYKQVNELGIKIKFEEVKNIDENNKYKVIKTNKNSYKAKNVIISTGRSPKKLGLLNEEELIGKGISYCATCDGAFYKDKKIAVVGGGNTSITESLFLSNIVSELKLIHRREQFRSEEKLLQNLKEKSNVNIRINLEIKEINKIKDKLHLTLSTEEMLVVDGLFIFIGYEPQLDFISNLDLKMNNGYISVDKKMKTNISGIYACGDIIDKDLYQLVTATGEASIAADSIKKELLLR